MYLRSGIICFVVVLLSFSDAILIDWEYKGFSFTNDKYCPNVTFDTAKSDLSLYNMRSTGANYVSLIVTNWQKTANTTTIFAVPNRTSTDAALVHAMGTAHKLGMKVMIKPQVDLTNDPTHWRGQIGENFTDSEWDEWFVSYTAMITHYAELAEENGVEVVSLGCELIATSPRDAQWRAVAASVRSVFTGLITYSSNWGGEETNKTWWDVVDFIGVDAYYPLVPGNPNATLDEMIDFWILIQTVGVANGVSGGYMRGSLQNLTQAWNKSLVFTETGACSGGCTKDYPVDMEHMNMYVESIFGAFYNVSWFQGMHWWNWVSDPAFGGLNNTCMTPAFKPAEQIFRTAYGGTYESIRPSYPALCACIL